MAALWKVLDRNEDFTAFFDLRQMKVGLRSKACFSYGVDFMAQERHASELDAQREGRVFARQVAGLADDGAVARGAV